MLQDNQLRSKRIQLHPMTIAACEATGRRGSGRAQAGSGHTPSSSHVSQRGCSSSSSIGSEGGRQHCRWPSAVWGAGHGQCCSMCACADGLLTQWNPAALTMPSSNTQPQADMLRRFVTECPGMCTSEKTRSLAAQRLCKCTWCSR